jgi:hypothetical protein
MVVFNRTACETVGMASGHAETFWGMRNQKWEQNYSKCVTCIMFLT